MKQKLIQWIIAHKIITFLGFNIALILISLLWTDECTSIIRGRAYNDFLNPFGLYENNLHGYLEFFGFIESANGPFFSYGPFQTNVSGVRLPPFGPYVCGTEHHSSFYIFSDILIVTCLGLFLMKAYQYFFKKS
ncbi:hypothetical protein K2X92_00670 [Candidatus Gracilibacteria bacterium]|nr:hypothetical protein [Candidatus Gracilibacteria bacterium]